jgi:hypothetical protein
MNQDQMAQDAQRIEDERLRVQEEEERLHREEELLTRQGAAARGQGTHRRGAGKGGKEAGAPEAIPGGPMAQRARFAFSATGKGYRSPSQPAGSNARLSGSGSSGGGTGAGGKAVGIGLLVVIVAAAAIYFGTSGKVDPKQVTKVAAQWLNGSPDRSAAELPDEAPRARDAFPAPAGPGSNAPAEAELPSAEPTVATPTSDGLVDANDAAASGAPLDSAREPETNHAALATADAASTSAASGSSHRLTPIAMRDAAGPEIVAKLAAIEARLDLIQAQVSSLASSVNSPGSAQRQQATRRARPSPPAAGSRTSSRDGTVAAKPPPAAEARSRAGQLLAVDVWGGVPSVVVGTGDPADRRTRVLRPGDSHNGVSLLHADPLSGQATFSAAGTTFTMNVKESG